MALKLVSALALAVCASVAHGAPPVLNIASEPLTAACLPTTPSTSTGEIDGASLVRLATGTATDRSVGDLFQASMNTADLGGHFTRYVMAAGASGLSLAPLIAWDAGIILTGNAAQPPFPAPAARKIYTAIVQDDGTINAIPFQWSALSPAQQAALSLAPPPDAAPDGLGELRLNYLRGERTQEGSRFRPRSSVLGESVHSTPVYVGQPSGARTAVRPDMIYLGANDGMLHGFNAADGREVFAYIPAALIPSLNRLTSVDYVQRAFVDGPATAGEAMIGGRSRTVLISGVGGGAQGVFALDVTDPAAFADSGGVLWEFTDRDDVMMGNVNTLPQIAKLRVRTVSGTPVYRHFAVVASGLNNYAADGNASSSGKGALFLLALDKLRDAPWRLNDNYYRLVTPVADATLANALNAPVLVSDRNGALRYAYGGDLQGNLWRFDFNGGAPWSDAVGPGANGAPLFVARDAAGNRQPISQQPQLAYAADGGYMVLFGTGKLIEKADRSAASFAPQTYYAIHDSLLTPPEIVTGRRQLARRQLSGGPASARFAIDGEPMTPQDKGWYVDLLQADATGERSVDSGVVEDGALVFNTLVPAADPCDASRSRTYVLNALTGLPDEQSVTARLPPSPSFPQPIIGELSLTYAIKPTMLPVARTTTFADPTGRTRTRKEFEVANVGPRGGESVGRARSTSRTGRLSWREVANWRQIYEASQ